MLFVVSCIYDTYYTYGYVKDTKVKKYEKKDADNNNNVMVISMISIAATDQPVISIK